MIVRDYRSADFKKGLVECLNALSETKLTTNRVINKFIRKRKKLGIRTIVSVGRESGRQIITGTVSIYIEPKFLHGGTYVGHIEDVAVHPNFQGQGIGRLLIDHAIHICRVAGCYKIVLYCSEAVRPFYEKSGFYYNGTEMRIDLNRKEVRD